MDPWLTLLAGSNNLCCSCARSHRPQVRAPTLRESTSSSRRGDLRPSFTTSTTFIRHQGRVTPPLRARSGIDYTFRQDQVISSTLHARFVTIGRIQAPVCRTITPRTTGDVLPPTPHPSSGRLHGKEIRPTATLHALESLVHTTYSGIGAVHRLHTLQLDLHVATGSRLRGYIDLC